MGEELFGTAESRSGGRSGRPARRFPLVLARSGRRVEFDLPRLAASLERARRAARHDDPALSSEVADIVGFSLSERENAGAEAGEGSVGVVDVDDLGGLAERVLVELGYAVVAREYILARDRKARRREARRGGGPVGDEGGRGATIGPLPAVRAGTGTEPFDARRIAAALVDEAGIEREVAEQVARRVADSLGGSSLREVSTSLVRELVSNELVALGLPDALKKHGAVGIPRHDLIELFEAARAPRLAARPLPSARAGGALFARFEDLATESLLERWLLADVLPAPVAEAHRTGAIHVIGGHAPHHVVARSLPVDLLRSSPRWTRAAALDLARLAALVGRDVAETVVLEELSGPIAALVGGPGSHRSVREAPVVDFVVALGAAAAAADRDLVLARPGPEAAGPLLRALASAVEDVGVSVQVCASLGEVDAAIGADGETADAAERLLATGHLVPVWAAQDTHWAGPGLVRLRGERGVLATESAVALNLPRLARRAGPWREDELLRGLLETVEVAVDALASLAKLHAAARGAQGALTADRVGFAVVPVGLVDSLGILGDGIARADQGARILGALVDAVERVGRARALPVRVALGPAWRAARTFAEADARVERPGQPRLFADLPRPEDTKRASYRTGLGSLVSGSPEEVFAGSEALASLLVTVPSGRLAPSAFELDGGARWDGRPLLAGDSADSARPTRAPAAGSERRWMAAWRRFDAARRVDVESALSTGEKSLF